MSSTTRIPRRIRAVSVGTDAEQFVEGNSRRTSLIIQHLGSGTLVIIENEDQATTDGFQLQTNEAYTFNEFFGDDPREAVFLIASAIGQDVRIFEEFAELD